MRIIAIIWSALLLLGCQSTLTPNTDMAKADSYYKTKQYKRALPLYLSLADQNHAHAQFRLGLMYRAGRGVKKNMSMAIRLLNLAANQHYPKAQTQLSYHYLGGHDVTQDINRGLALLKSAAKQNHPEAMYRLASHYLNGEKVEKDIAYAVQLLQPAAKAGHVRSEYVFGRMLVDGNGVKQDSELGTKYILHAAEKNYRPAKAYLKSLIKRQSNQSATTSSKKQVSATDAPASHYLQSREYQLAVSTVLQQKEAHGGLSDLSQHLSSKKRLISYPLIPVVFIHPRSSIDTIDGSWALISFTLNGKGEPNEVRVEDGNRLRNDDITKEYKRSFLKAKFKTSEVSQYIQADIRWHAIVTPDGIERIKS